MTTVLIILGLVVVGVAVALVVVGVRSPQAADPLQARLAEYSAREKPATLEEIELSQPFTERVILPIARKFGEFVVRFTPAASIKSIQHMLDLAGNPRGLDPTLFYSLRIIAAVGLAAFAFLIGVISPRGSALSIHAAFGPVKIMAIALVGALLGFNVPSLLLRSKIRRRQDEVIKAMPDALDLLTVCVEAGLGFDQAMMQVAEKWDNELSIAFGRDQCAMRRLGIADMSIRRRLANIAQVVSGAKTVRPLK